MKQENFDSWWWRVLCTHCVVVLLWTPGVQEEEWGDRQWKEKPALLAFDAAFGSCARCHGQRERGAEARRLVESLWSCSGDFLMRALCRMLLLHLVARFDPHPAERFTSCWITVCEYSRERFLASILNFVSLKSYEWVRAGATLV